MKKLLTFLLLAAMLAAFSACNKVQDDPVPSDPQYAVESKDDSSVSETPSSDDDDTDPKDLLGSYSESSYTYVNSFIGIGCKLNADWEVCNAEQIAEINDMVLDQLTDKKLSEQLQSRGLVTPFSAQYQEGNITLNISLENLGVLYGSLLSERQYAEKSAMQIPPALEFAGVTDVTATVDTIFFAGSDHAAILVSGSVQGNSLYETLVCVKIDNYMVIITASSLLTDVTGDTLSAFYGL